MVDTQKIRNGIASLPKDIQDQILILLEKEESGNETKNMKLLGGITIPANTQTFDPKIIFAAGEHDGTKFYHGDNFKKYIFKPAKLVGGVEVQNFKSYESKINLYDKQIREEIGQQVIKPDQLWTAWKDLIFKQPQGQSGSLKNNGYSNVWYVQCADGIVRAVDCFWFADFSEWYLSCNELVGGRWRDVRQFFVGDDLVTSVPA